VISFVIVFLLSQVVMVFATTAISAGTPCLRISDHREREDRAIVNGQIGPS
jgi:hypothetical protein